MSLALTTAFLVSCGGNVTSQPASDLKEASFADEWV
jgi:hypothetical protein